MTSYTGCVFVYWCVGEVAPLCPCTNTATVAECGFSAFVLISRIVLVFFFPCKPAACMIICAEVSVCLVCFSAPPRGREDEG